MSPVFERFDDRKEFLIMGLVVPFSFRELSTPERYWVPLRVCVAALEQDSRYREVGPVSFNADLLLRIKMNE